jgi:integrase
MKPEPKNKIEKVTVGNVTVKIYTHEKKNGYRVFEVSDYSKGYRVLRSFSDRAEAFKEAEKIARQLATGETLAAQMKSKEAAEYVRAKEILPIGMNLITVVSHCAEAIKILGSDRIIEAAKELVRRNPVERPSRTVKQVADELIELKIKRNVSERYQQELKYQLNKICERFGGDVSTVTTGDLQLWFDRLDAAPRSIRNLRSAAATLFRFAEARCYIGKGENPALATEKIKAKNGDDIEIYSVDEIARLLDKADESIKPALAIQAFTGIRTAELMRLDWQAVKFNRRHIEITASNAKTASRRIVPITPNLGKWLKPHSKKTGMIFPSGADYYHELQREAATATKTDTLPPVELKQNGLRHSFISYRVADTKNVAQVALEAGNSAQMIFQHYRELVTPRDAKAWFSIVPKKAKP